MQTKLIKVDSIIIDEEFNSRDQIDFSSIVDLSKSILRKKMTLTGKKEGDWYS